MSAVHPLNVVIGCLFNMEFELESVHSWKFTMAIYWIQNEYFE